MARRASCCWPRTTRRMRSRWRGRRKRSGAGSRWSASRPPTTSSRAASSRRSGRSSAVNEVPLAGVVRERGGGLRSDFCVLARIEPGRPAKLSYPDDEDELEEYQPDYLARAPYHFCRALLEQASAGQRPDLLRAIFERRIRLQGDLQRLVKHAGRHRGAGMQALRAVRTEFV